MSFWKPLNVSFTAICVLSAVVLAAYWCYKYSLDEDNLQMKYKEYLQSKDDVFPVLSMCFVNPVVEEKLKEYSTELNESMYYDFLSGNIFTFIVFNACILIYLL